MWIYNKEMNLCEELKPSTIPHISSNVTYLTIENYKNLPQPSLGLSITASLTKA